MISITVWFWNTLQSRVCDRNQNHGRAVIRYSNNLPLCPISDTCSTMPSKNRGSLLTSGAWCRRTVTCSPSSLVKSTLGLGLSAVIW
jgi:hypothetical protein